MLRLRLKVIVCPRRELALTDTPRPDCDNCHGRGGTVHDYGDYDTGEFAGTDYEPCDCWTAWRLPLLPLPSWLRRRPRGGYSAEPPF
ncbi:hypothetical protein [Streptomyces acidiscabies]|uniref:Uncharacterized protein n=1 Tax=Streptomyces acidiscabies TaxID=42234 RepID=A0ABU4M9W0_9ACTN|nr:hypothetical protein [Streptomyces acidiscabies]MBP5938556.1 hypothetical protein [Streptomyces sp. LBUM 1476]MDX3024541.1 hypothetical protein [Streptomyces acidiscabies]